jgi:type IV secretory pathway VirJ component
MLAKLLFLLLPLLIPALGQDCCTPHPARVAHHDRGNAAPPENPGEKHFPDLPVIAFPADTSMSDLMVLVISGDGGWNVWEESLQKEFYKKGFPVAGLDALKYFWKEKNPEQVTSDLTRVLAYYMKTWKKQHFILAGYSFGANVVPFVATRLQEPWKSMLKKVVMISPDPEADFEIHLLNMINIEMPDYKYQVTDEVRKIRGIKVQCMFGVSEDEGRRDQFHFPPVEYIEFPGKHHLKFNFQPIVEKILQK